METQMSGDEKHILEMFVKYGELVNAELLELNSRIETLPSAYPKAPSPGPQTQLLAIKEALSKLSG
jgi:hypothetical protein